MSPVLPNNKFVEIKSTPDCNGFFGSAEKKGKIFALGTAYVKHFIECIKSGVEPKRAIVLVNKVKDMVDLNDYLINELSDYVNFEERGG